MNLENDCFWPFFQEIIISGSLFRKLPFLKFFDSFYVWFQRTQKSACKITTRDYVTLFKIQSRLILFLNWFLVYLIWNKVCGNYISPVAFSFFKQFLAWLILRPTSLTYRPEKRDKLITPEGHWGLLETFILLDSMYTNQGNRFGDIFLVWRAILRVGPLSTTVVA